MTFGGSGGIPIGRRHSDLRSQSLVNGNTLRPCFQANTSHRRKSNRHGGYSEEHGEDDDGTDRRPTREKEITAERKAREEENSRHRGNAGTDGGINEVSERFTYNTSSLFRDTSE